MHSLFFLSKMKKTAYSYIMFPGQYPGPSSAVTMVLPET